MPEAAAPTLILLPNPGGAPLNVGSIRDLPPQQARVDRAERWRTNTRWGDLQAPTLANVLNQAAEGNTCDWMDLCEYMIGSDDHLGSLYDTRISRVAQADYVIGPNPFGDPKLAAQAAELVNELMLRVENWYQASRDLLGAIFGGYAVGEMYWEYDDAKSTPSKTPTNYVKFIEHVHGHRFRYDETWQLRLYDQGRRPKNRTGGSIYGEALDPRKMIVHHHRMQGGYPGIGGILRSGAWRWMFRRWLDKLWIGGIETHGVPVTYASVPANTPGATKRQILDQIRNMISDHVGVIEMPGTLEQLGDATESFAGYQEYMEYSDRSLTKLVLGASDVVEPGANGSQSASNSRISTTTDPRMVTDGRNFMGTLHGTLWKQMIYMNAHKFPCAIEQVPIPVGRFKTADDEIKRDASDKAEEQQADLEAGIPAPPTADRRIPEVGRDMRSDMLELLPARDSKASSSDLLEIVKAVQAKQVQPDAAVELLMLGGVEAERAHCMCGLTFGVTGRGPDPKATAPVAPGRASGKANRATSGRSRSPFVLGLRSGSADQAHSPSKPSQMPLKL